MLFRYGCEPEQHLNSTRTLESRIMLRLIVGRLLFMFPAGLLVVTVLFGLFYFVPGDPAELIAGETATQATIDAIRAKYGFDQPLWVQFTTYLGNILQGDMGVSVYSRQPVAEVVFARLWNTALLAVPAQVLAMVLSLMFGCVAAMHWNRPLDKLITVVSLLGICTPIFVLGLLAIYFFSIELDLFPIGGMGSFQHYILPVATLGVAQSAYLTRMVRSSMIDALNRDYIVTARAKGVSEFWIVFKHALRNALLPVVTLFGLSVGTTLGGSVITESIFSWPGLGRLMIDSILQRDLPVTQGSLLVFAGIFILVNLIVDITYGLIDPRIRHG